MIRQYQVYMGSVCCLACFKLDQDEAFISGVMLSLGSNIKCVQCGSDKCTRVDDHVLGCGDD